MAFSVLFFAAAKERAANTERIELELSHVRESQRLGQDAAVSVKAAIDHVQAKFPDLALLLPSCMYAVNMEYVDRDTTFISNGDEVAIIPPVSGG
ncbi:hypothetical protein HDU79_004454 [Rhizoclosmatium sp. JEL0117]|nr:hypothetical protein HDU99_001942 [Rhizoclosmatium hyalinum]KAJ3288925.1 hypothetical protein HDU79_004454 [Rhizoclosmatium sp. JEL0117]